MRGGWEDGEKKRSGVKPSSEEEGSSLLTCNCANLNPRLEKGGQSVMSMLIATQQDDINASASARADEVSDHIYSFKVLVCERLRVAVQCCLLAS